MCARCCNCFQNLDFIKNFQRTNCKNPVPKLITLIYLHFILSKMSFRSNFWEMFLLALRLDFFALPTVFELFLLENLLQLIWVFCPQLISSTSQISNKHAPILFAAGKFVFKKRFFKKQEYSCTKSLCKSTKTSSTLSTMSASPPHVHQKKIKKISWSLSNYFWMKYKSKMIFQIFPELENNCQT